MNEEEQKLADLAEASRVGQTKINKTWFIERTGDKKIFACEENEASEIMYNRGNWMRRDFKIIGVSDGTTYQKVIAESQGKSKDVFAEIQALELELKRYRQLEEKMIFEELVDPNDTDPKTLPQREKLLKLRGIIDGYLKKIEGKNEEYRKLTKGINEVAFQAELEVARGHIERPGNKNILTPGATGEERQKIIKSMKG
jgi:hypothetical protein